MSLVTNSSARPAALKRLHGKIVLIKSARDHHHPPAGIRGTSEVIFEGKSADKPAVRLSWEIPDMFEVPAHRRTMILRDEESMQRLLASEREGTFEFVIDQNLD